MYDKGNDKHIRRIVREELEEVTDNVMTELYAIRLHNLQLKEELDKVNEQQKKFNRWGLAAKLTVAAFFLYKFGLMEAIKLFI